MMTPRLFALLPALAASAASAQIAIGGGGAAELWNNNCASCHMTDGRGGGAGTRSLLDDEFEFGSSDRELFNSIKQGHPDSGMEPFGETLKDPQIWSLVVYIHELRYKHHRETVGSPKADPDGVYRSTHHAFRVEPVATSGLDVPWSVDWLPDGSMLIADRPGGLFLRAAGTPADKPGTRITGTPRVRNRGQGGLMDVAPHPDHAANGWIYLAYSHELQRDGRSHGMTRIVRGKIANSQWTDEQVIWEAKPEHYLPTDLHFGSRIVFERSPAGAWNIFFSIGERGRMEHAQRLDLPNGKIHRIADDGSIPADNPFSDRADAYHSIWSYGHRNPQGLAFDINGNLWDTEHGPRGGDELNLVRRGANYGWPIVSFGINYNGAPLRTPWPDVSAPDQPDAAAIVMPTAVWTPSVGASGLDNARGPSFSKWNGDLFAGGLSGESVDRFRLAPDPNSPGAFIVSEREEIIRGLGRVRDVVCGPDGMIYVVLNGPDRIIRLAPAD